MPTDDEKDDDYKSQREALKNIVESVLKVIIINANVVLKVDNYDVLIENITALIEGIKDGTMRSKDIINAIAKENGDILKYFPEYVIIQVTDEYIEINNDLSITNNVLIARVLRVIVQCITSAACGADTPPAYDAAPEYAAPQGQGPQGQQAQSPAAAAAPQGREEGLDDGLEDDGDPGPASGGGVGPVEKSEAEIVAQKEIDVTLEKMRVLRHEMDDLMSNYEEAMLNYNEGVGEGWAEDKYAKDVAGNVVELYRMMQDQHGNLAAARNEMLSVGHAVSIATNDKDFAVLFPDGIDKDGKAKGVDPLRPFSPEMIEETYERDASGKEIPNKHTKSPHVEVDVYGETADALYRRALDLPATVTALYRDVSQRLMELSERVLAADIKARYDRLGLLLIVDFGSNRRPLYNKAMSPADIQTTKKKEDEPPGHDLVGGAPQRNRGAAGRGQGRYGYGYGVPNIDGRNGRVNDRGMTLRQVVSEYTHIDPREDAFKTKVEDDQEKYKGILDHPDNKKLFADIRASPLKYDDYIGFQNFMNHVMMAHELGPLLDAYRYDYKTSLTANSNAEAPPDVAKVLGAYTRANSSINKYVPLANSKEYKIPYAPMAPDAVVAATASMVAKMSDGTAPPKSALPPGGVAISTTKMAGPEVDKGLFTRLVEMYRNAKPDEKRKAGERVVDTVDTTAALNREEALRLTLVDRLIFVVVTLVVRAAALRGATVLVNRGVLRTLRGAIIVYALIYSLLVMLLVGAVTLDDGVLRIALNYLNPHAHLPSVVLHLMVLWMLVLVVVSVLMAEYTTLSGDGGGWFGGSGGGGGGGVAPIVLSTADKADVVQNLTSLSFFSWMVTTFQVVAPL